jgi:hypothetical protein
MSVFTLDIHIPGYLRLVPLRYDQRSLTFLQSYIDSRCARLPGSTKRRAAAGIGRVAGRVLHHPRCSLASAAHPATAEHLLVFAAGPLVRLELDTD